ncbi:hypothetical protein OHT20_37245 [Streptomyces caniferus]|uniref:Uncharacterized protein n=1 Tax=Streptomyces caniferus TaxID=285557 RepID=A0ABZ1VZN1_9ACTN|nr:hypothetical protein [Streptomyces caniferus]
MEHAPAAMCAVLGPRTQHTRRLDRVQSQIDASRRGQEGVRPQRLLFAAAVIPGQRCATCPSRVEAAAQEPAERG